MSIGLLFGIATEILGTPIFLLFMLEEAVQTLGFGVFVLMQRKSWKDARVQVGYYRAAALKMKEWAENAIETAKILNPRTEADLPNLTEQLKNVINNIKFIVGKLTGTTQTAVELKAGDKIAVLFQPFLVFAEASIMNADAYDKAITKGMREELSS